MSEPKGIYQTQFTPTERALLAMQETTPLQAEIDLIRVAMKRMLKISKSQTPDEQVKTLTMLSTVSSRMAHLVKIQNELTQKTPGGTDSDLRAMLEQALTEAQATWPQL